MTTTTTWKKLALSALALLVAGTLMLATPIYAFGWTADTEGNSETDNSSDVNGVSSGETAVQGWIGTFDGTENPNRPDPPAEAWINVKIPITALFGSLSTDGGALYSPQYHIYNYSVRGVDITPTAFTATGTEPTELSGMELNLDFTSPVAEIIALRDASDTFLGAGLPNSTAITLAGGSSAVPTTATFEITGLLPVGFTYPSGTPYEPTYNLTFSFASIAPTQDQ